MKNRRVLFVMVAQLVSMVLTAGNVTEEQALKKACQFMKDKQFAAPSLRRAAAPSFADGAFYVFNADNQQGFVIVSADDRTLPILGYSDQGTLDISNLPANAKAWLESYARQVQALDNGVTAVETGTQFQAIAPLLTCKWGQDEPYNLRTPIDTNKEGKQVHSVTGCGATAMAQLMFHHKLPSVKAIPAYTTESRNFKMDELPAYDFNWDLIKSTYDKNDSEESRQEVAKLMLYCGQSIKMNYTAGASDGMPTPEAFINYFGYSKQACEVRRFNYTRTEWDQLMYNELAASRPILYYGDGTLGAHEFVVDGCDAQGLFHINWGWDGESDGYFILSIANSNSLNITGAKSAQGFDYYQAAIIGLQKPQEGEQTPMGQIFYYPTLDKTTMTYNRSSASEDFTGVSLSFWCSFLEGSPQENVDYAAAIYSGSQRVALETLAENVATKDNFISVTKSINIGASLSGDCYIKLLCRRSGTQEWQPAYVYEALNATPAVAPLCYFFSINGNKLELFLSDMRLNTINTKVNSVTFSRRPTAGRALTSTINWTCRNLYNNTNFYLFFEGTSKYVGKVSAYQSYGETADVDIVFTPKVAGEQNYYLTIDEEGKTLVYDGTLTIAAPQQHNMTATMTIGGQSPQGEEDLTVTTTSISSMTTIRNNGTQTYDDVVCISLNKMDENNKFIGTPMQRVTELSLAPGAETTLSYDFTGLEDGARYYLSVMYYSKKNATAGDWAGEEKEAGFANIRISTDASAVQSVRQVTAADCVYYSLDGQRLVQPRRGLNIVRLSDGTTRKFINHWDRKVP